VVAERALANPNPEVQLLARGIVEELALKATHSPATFSPPAAATLIDSSGGCGIDPDEWISQQDKLLAQLQHPSPVGNSQAMPSRTTVADVSDGSREQASADAATPQFHDRALKGSAAGHHRRRDGVGLAGRTPQHPAREASFFFSTL
jgi:hypothetical protein